MEFYVVDPKSTDYQGWTDQIRIFLTESDDAFTEAGGELYYLGDDIATPWDEESVLFTVIGENGGVVEVRDVDRNFYVFADDLDLFGERETRDATGYTSRSVGALYGFEWNNHKHCRFHLGPSTGSHFFCEGDSSDFPVALPLEDVWAQFFRAVYWLGNNTSRLQDLKRVNVEKVFMDFEVDVSFAHPASLDVLTDILVEESGYERSRSGVRAVFRNRDLAWIQRFVSLLPTDSKDFDRAFFRAVWRGLSEGEEREVFFVGVERRNLRPFVQMPLHRTSKKFLERFRARFKGHRIDRQEYGPTV